MPAVADRCGRNAIERRSARGTRLRARSIGVVHLSAVARRAAFRESRGRPSRPGQTLCVIEAMKVFNEVRAERDGPSAAVLVASGDEVEAGQPLLRFA